MVYLILGNEEMEQMTSLWEGTTNLGIHDSRLCFGLFLDQPIYPNKIWTLNLRSDFKVFNLHLCSSDVGTIVVFGL